MLMVIRSLNCITYVTLEGIIFLSAYLLANIFLIND